MEKKYLSKAGKYMAVVKRPPNGWFGEIGEKKTPFIRLPLIVQENAEMETDDQIGKEIVWRGFITEAAVGRTVKALVKAFGWNGDLAALAADQYLTAFENPDMVVLENGKTTDSDPFTGKTCKITCEEEEYDGKTRVVIKWLNPAEGQEPSVMDHGSLKSIVAGVAEIAKNAAKEALDEQKTEKPKSSKPAPNVRKREEKKTDEDGDEIPF
jgi:hypothetical protein